MARNQNKARRGITPTTAEFEKALERDWKRGRKSRQECLRAGAAWAATRAEVEWPEWPAKLLEHVENPYAQGAIEEMLTFNSPEGVSWAGLARQARNYINATQIVDELREMVSEDLELAAENLELARAQQVEVLQRIASLELGKPTRATAEVEAAVLEADTARLGRTAAQLRKEWLTAPILRRWPGLRHLERLQKYPLEQSENLAKEFEARELRELLNLGVWRTDQQKRLLEALIIRDPLRWLEPSQEKGSPQTLWVEGGIVWQGNEMMALRVNPHQALVFTARRETVEALKQLGYEAIATEKYQVENGQNEAEIIEGAIAWQILIGWLNGGPGKKFSVVGKISKETNPPSVEKGIIRGLQSVSPLFEQMLQQREDERDLKQWVSLYRRFLEPEGYTPRAETIAKLL